MSEQKTLLLDAGFQPIKAITWQRAVTLLTLGKVEIISEYDGFIRSPTLVIKIPAVARLLRVFKKYRRPVKFSRISIFARDKYTCQYCGVKRTINDLTYDHVTPRAQGGKTEWSNIVTACSDCNKLKGARTPNQAKMRLLSVPVRPNWVPAIEIQLSNNPPMQWQDFLYWNQELDE